ncbi:MAG: CidA/LrgA family protein [Bacteroidales bacterium]
MIKGLLLLFTFLFLGEITAMIGGEFLPGSVIGMLYLLLSLMLGWVNPDSVKATAKGLTNNMAIFFIPAAVGIMNAVDIILDNWLAILLSVIMSTIVMFWVVGSIQQSMSRSKEREEKSHE